MPENILILGANGQLGSEFARLAPDAIKLTHQDLDVTNKDKVFEAIGRYRPDFVINTTAFHVVDECEANPYSAFAVNAFAVKNLSEACRTVGSCIVHFSTDYVFDGDKNAPYIETDTPNPINLYGLSKLTGEGFITSVLEADYFIIRTAYLFGPSKARAKGTNLVEKMLKLGSEREEVKASVDQIISPTYAADLAKKVLQLLDGDEPGIYHVTNQGIYSVYDFTRLIFNVAGLKTKLTPVSMSEFKTIARRPKFSALRNGRLIEMGLDDMLPLEDALKEYIARRN